MSSCPAGNVTVTAGETTIVEVVTAGPQGPPGPQGPQGPPGSGGGTTINATGVVDKSLVYWNATAQEFQANGVWTTDTIVDGSNF